MEIKHNDHAVGIDLGGTKLEVGLINELGALVTHEQYPTKVKEGYQEVVKNIADAVQEMKKKSSAIKAVGIGMAGQIDPQRGVVQFAPNLKWHDVPLKQDLEKMTGLPVRITNDVRAATWGEWLYGAGKDCQDLVCLFVGTGIGGGIVSGGKMLTGTTNTAGELGHMVIAMDGPLCSCGNHGCFEAFAGGWAIAKRAQNELSNHSVKSKKILSLAGEILENVSAKHVFEAALENDILAKEIINSTAQILISGCVGIVNALNPSKLILGGGVIKGFPDFVSLIDNGVKKYALKAATASLTIERAHFKEDAGVIGAAAWALRSLN